MDRTVPRAAHLARSRLLAGSAALTVAAVAIAPAAGAAAVTAPGAAAPTSRTEPRTVSVPGGRLPTVTAASFVVADIGSGAILAARDAHAPAVPASTLKMLTAIVTMRRLQPTSVVIVSAGDAAARGSVAGLVPAREYTVADLWNALLLASGNDAALALARTYPGGSKALVAAMNAEAKRIGATDTRVLTPTGLDTPGQVTSAYDLALIARDGLAQPRFDAVVARRTATLPAAEGERVAVVNRNQLLGTYRGAIGVKTGDTPQAGSNLVAAARRGGRTLLVVLMTSRQQVFDPAKRLLDWGFATPTGTAGVSRLVAGAAVNSSHGATAHPSQPATSPDPAAVESTTAQPSDTGFRLSAVLLALLGLLVLTVLLVPVSLRPADGSEPRRGPRRGSGPPPGRAGPTGRDEVATVDTPVATGPGTGEPPAG